VVVHQTCAPDGNCPKCGEPFLPTEVVHHRLNPAQQTKRDRPTSVTLLAGWAFLGAGLGLVRLLVGLGVMASDGSDAADRALEGGLQLLISGATGRGLLAGHGWARKFYLWGWPVLIALDFVLTDLSSGMTRYWLAILVQSAAYGVWAYLLNRPTVIEFFRTRTPPA
jgi:hypothetical protein